MLDFKSFMKHIASPGYISFKCLNVEILLASTINVYKEMLKLTNFQIGLDGILKRSIYLQKLRIQRSDHKTFPLTAQTVKNVAFSIQCEDCKTLCILHNKIGGGGNKIMKTTDLQVFLHLWFSLVRIHGNRRRI